MLLNSGTGKLWAVTCRPTRRVTCLSGSIPSTEQLRAQLDQLQSEAETARAKANNARVRLLRLSEAAENLKRQAAVSVRTGKEDDARELLFQKKKVMEALDKSKSRIELLNELSTKLNEAISLKERQLIGNVAWDLEDVREDPSSSVRIVSPVPEVTEDLIEHDDLRSNDKESSDNQELQSVSESQAKAPVDLKLEDFQVSMPGITSSGETIVRSLERLTSFGTFLEHMDEQLNGIESELVTVLRVSTLILDGEEKTKNFKVQRTMELLESIREIRQRVANIRIAEVESK